jgi:hypothetical protein
MTLLFFDETSDSKFPDYFGLCCASINSLNYPSVKSEFHAILTKYKWNTACEFKGAYLFSATQGDCSIPIEVRIDIARELLDLNKAETNARIKFHYFRKKSENHKIDYLSYLPALIKKALPQSKPRKNLVSVHFDKRTDITAAEFRQVVISTIEREGYILFEDIVVLI